MPVFDYKCEDCGKQYDVFHKGREIETDVVCPSCGSARHKRLMSVTNIGKSAGGGSYGDAIPEKCENCCDKDSCHMN